MGMKASSQPGPAHDDDGHTQTRPILFFDGVCGLCNRFVDLMLKADSRDRFRYAPLQGETALNILGPQDEDPPVLPVNGSRDSIRTVKCRSAGVETPGWLMAADRRTVRISPSPARSRLPPRRPEQIPVVRQTQRVSTAHARRAESVSAVNHSVPGHPPGNQCHRCKPGRLPIPALPP